MNEVSQLYGLVLAGGNSTRMGKDKRQLHYHGMSQQEYTFSLLELFCERVFISVHEAQIDDTGTSKYILDENIAKGPLNGMLSAHVAHPKVAWLVLACDTPLVDKEVLDALVAERDTSKMATAMATQKTDRPEPLIAIWESHALARLLNYSKTATNMYPTKFLLNHSIHKVYPKQDVKLMNVNHPEDFDKIKNLLKTPTL
ncbi:MAG: NTP transferase domain-containing protein [Bacteroidota bacterium]